MHNIRQSRHNLQTTTNTNTIIIPNNIKKTIRRVATNITKLTNGSSSYCLSRQSCINKPLIVTATINLILTISPFLSIDFYLSDYQVIIISPPC